MIFIVAPFALFSILLQTTGSEASSNSINSNEEKISLHENSSQDHQHTAGEITNPTSNRRSLLGLCEGYCDDDSQCEEGLVCHRGGPFDAVSKCSGVNMGDFCIEATTTRADNTTTDTNVNDEVGTNNDEVSYFPGNLTTYKDGLLLSHGLDTRLVAVTNEYVEYSDGNLSNIVFHGQPDAGACFPDTRPNNPGGWVYQSNSENLYLGTGGVGAITFDSQGNTIDYTMSLVGTTRNCGGGRTPWGAWITCEEGKCEEGWCQHPNLQRIGHCYQVDPSGERRPEKIILGDEGGQWESFAYDDRDRDHPHFFITEDNLHGALARFTPFFPDWNDPWSILLNPNGRKDYLVLQNSNFPDSGSFYWTEDKEEAMANTATLNPYSEGIDRVGSDLIFVCKTLKMVYTLHLDDGTWERSSTQSGLFDAQPDTISRILMFPKDLLYFTEDGRRNAGVHARDINGRFYTILESPDLPGETTGLSFTSDGKIMYIAYQEPGRLYAVWRQDGRAFGAEHVDIKYHESNS